MSRTLYVVYQILTLGTLIYGTKNYDGYKLYEAIPADPVQESILTDIAKLGYDVWSWSPDGTKILVSPNLEETFKNVMDQSGIFVKVLQENIGDTIRKQEVFQQSTRRFGGQTTGFNFDRFPRYNEIVNFTRNLAKRSKHAEMISIGESFEGRPIVGLKLEGSKSNPKIFIDAGIHAREWASPVTALFLMQKIVDHEDTLRRKVSIYVIPLLNPDGYEYSHINDRLWRKTRSRINGTKCVGADANRNFDSHWAEFGAKLDPCSDTFPGSGPFTESESRAVRDALLRIRPNMYLTLHSYGPLLLYPWGFTESLPDNWQELDKLATTAADKLKQVNGQDYEIGSSTRVLYKASGGSDDWAMQVANVPLVYTMELPDYGQGFIMPEEKIRPMIKETYEAFKVFVKYVCAIRHNDCRNIL